MSCYQVLFDGLIVGSVEVTQEGLYYRFRCRCTVPQNETCRLIATVSAQEYDLGICVPEGKISIVDKKIPIKHFPTGEINFHILGKKASLRAVPVLDNKAFPYVASLCHAKLRIKEGKYEILI